MATNAGEQRTQQAQPGGTTQRSNQVNMKYFCGGPQEDPELNGRDSAKGRARRIGGGNVDRRERPGGRKCAGAHVDDVGSKIESKCQRSRRSRTTRKDGSQIDAGRYKGQHEDGEQREHAHGRRY